ncbi:MAG: hypothetical protein IT365_04185 [Candidatus Hydrogenedentes bacterium]|nr:hypothetical protein [Candidatus Hydrogenedentota bacterium]
MNLLPENSIRFFPCIVRGRLLLCAVFAWGFSALSQPVLNPPVRVYTPTWEDSTADRPALAKGMGDTWIAVWQSNDPIDGQAQNEDVEIHVSRSVDGGATWSFPTVLPGNTYEQGRQDRAPRIASDGAGHLVVVWETRKDRGMGIGTDGDVVASRSANDGVTWTQPVLLNSFGTADDAEDDTASVCYDGRGAWVAVWRSRESVISGSGSDFDIFTSRSVDMGATWSAAALLNTHGLTDTAHDNQPCITSDGEGKVIAAWSGEGAVSGPTGNDEDVFFARSVNGGANWAQTALLNADGLTDSSMDRLVTLASDGTGQWVAAWSSHGNVDGVVDADADIAVARSLDDGQSWTTPALLNANGLDDAAKDWFPHVAADRQGNWIAVWLREEVVSESMDPWSFAYLSWSSDAGKSWSAPALLDTHGLVEFSFDRWPVAAGDASGTWFSMWSTNRDATGAIADEQSIVYSRFQLAPKAKLRVIRPNGGEVFVQGFKWALRWNSVGDTGSSVRILLIKDGQKVKRIRRATSNDGKCSWNIKPGRFPVGDGYKIRIIPLENGAAKDVSDGTFSIVAP